MRIAIGSDHAGFAYKAILRPLLEAAGHEVLDVGATSEVPDDDYPDYGGALAIAMQQDSYERGILICGSAVGVSVTANKFKGIRAGICHDTYSAHQGVEHDNMNVLCIGERIVGIELAKDIVTAYLRAIFSGEPRHIRRLEKIAAIETKNFR